MTRPHKNELVDSDLRRISVFQRLLLAWYSEHASTLPWRDAPGPYEVLVSEFMLQQTQRARVTPKYVQFMARFPTVALLAGAGRADVIRAWSGLGYNSRAVRLHEAARLIVQDGWGDGEPSRLRTLPGVGEYTAAAIACFGFGRAEAAVDTNAVRVLRRVLQGECYPKPQKALDLRLARAVLPARQPVQWNSAVMDLGATICTARQPRCASCPLESICLAAPVLGAPARHGRLAAEPRAQYDANDMLKRPKERFEDSTRYLRGRIVDVLRTLEPAAAIGCDEIAERIYGALPRPDSVRVAAQAEALVREGLAERVPTPDGGPGFRLPT